MKSAFLWEGLTIRIPLDKGSQGRYSRYVVALGFAAIYAVLLSFFRPELILSATTTAGGDTGAHIYVGHFLKDHLLPKGKIAGWSPDWYAGFPMLQFYFPLAFLFIAAASTIIKYEVAFKLGTLLGTFLLPVTVYWAFKVLRFKFPMPLIAAAFTLPFLFMESYSIYGANILSTLAGEFGYSLSFALSILFLALLYRDVSEERFRVSTAVLLALIALSHVVTTIMLVALSSYYLINRLTLRRVAILAGVFGLGFALSAAWSLPFIAKLGYTAHMQWDQLKGLNELFPEPVRPFLALTALGLVGAVARRDSRMYLFLWAFILSLALFFVLPPGRLWNGRVLPYFYIFTFLWAAYGLWFSRRLLAQLLYGALGLPKRYAEYALGAVAVALVALTVASTSTVAATWIKWNYSGFEGKAQWPAFNRINQYIKGLPEGRVMVEHSGKFDAFGTPRAFELLPYFAEHPTMEGTLMEASFSAPFHFVNQAELSKEPSYAILGVEYPPLDVDAGVRHLQLYNIRYLLALSDEVKGAADTNPDLSLLKTFAVPDGDMELALYEVKTQGYVTVPEYEPVLVSTGNWRDTALAWYARPDLLDVPILDASRAGALKGQYKRVAGDLADVPRTPLRGGAVADVRLTDDALEFTTNAVGKPHWVKISYFPNWKVEGADGPYLASPTVMMVIPRQKNVRLYYGSTPADVAGGALSLAAWLFVGAHAGRLAWQKAPAWRRSLARGGEAEREPLKEEPEGSCA